VFNICGFDSDCRQVVREAKQQILENNYSAAGFSLCVFLLKILEKYEKNFAISAKKHIVYIQQYYF
jgi:hypothetical protein